MSLHNIYFILFKFKLPTKMTQFIFKTFYAKLSDALFKLTKYGHIQYNETVVKSFRQYFMVNYFMNLYHW